MITNAMANIPPVIFHTNIADFAATHHQYGGRNLMDRKMDYDTLYRKYKATLERERYWREQAGTETDYWSRLFDVLEADPEVKWLVLMLGAGAIEFLMDKAKTSTPDTEQKTEKNTLFTTLLGITSPAALTAMAGKGFFDTATKSNWTPADIGLAAMSPAYLVHKILDLGLAGDISAFAAMMLILGRLDTSENGMLSKVLTVGGV